MLSLSLGPIALPLAPVLLLIAIWGSSWLASRLAAKLHAPSTIAVNQDAAFALPQSNRIPSAAVSVTPYPAPAKP